MPSFAELWARVSRLQLAASLTPAGAGKWTFRLGKINLGPSKAPETLILEALDKVKEQGRKVFVLAPAAPTVRPSPVVVVRPPVIPPAKVLPPAPVRKTVPPEAPQKKKQKAIDRFNRLF